MVECAATTRERRLGKYREAALAVHGFLQRSVCDSRGYPDHPSWGYAFSVLLSAAVGRGRFTSLGEVAARHLSKQDVSTGFSWEFVVYAIQQCKRILIDGGALPFDIHRSKGTRMFNWFLLRQLNRGWFGCGAGWTFSKLRLGKKFYTTTDGQILDEFCTRSLQYHAFCLFLLCELHQQHLNHQNERFLRDWIADAARFSMRHVLSDGSALWIGRGQEQIFGYGSLVYALEYVNSRIEPVPAQLLLNLQRHVLSFQRPDGSLPLVLRRRDPEAENTTFANAPLGWYGYNTIFDYLPFLGYALWRTAELAEPSTPC